jgi:hypothetical protein
MRSCFGRCRCRRRRRRLGTNDIDRFAGCDRSKHAGKSLVATGGLGLPNFLLGIGTGARHLIDRWVLIPSSRSSFFMTKK